MSEGEKEIWQKFRGLLSTLVRFLGVQWKQACLGVLSPFKVKDKLLYLASSITEATYSSFRSTIAHLLSDPKNCLFWMGLRTREGSATGPGCCASCFPIWLYDPEDPMVLEVSGRERYYLDLLAGSYRRTIEQGLRILKWNPIILHR